MTAASDLMSAGNEMPRQHISDAELWGIQRRVELLNAAINATEHRQHHVAISMHNLLLGLSVSERSAVIGYVQDRLKEGAN
jgi:hypothetical protein